MTVPHKGKGWQLAPAMIAMEAEADRIAPRRRRTSDGSIGDAAHAARKSNHNHDGGYVDALDISHDPANGMDIHAHARAMVARQEPRLEEVISNRQIWTWDRRREGWRRYTGQSPHTLHAHFTVKNSHRFDTSPWFSSVPPFPTPPLPPPYNPQPAPQPVAQVQPRRPRMLISTPDGKVWFTDLMAKRYVPTPANVGGIQILLRSQGYTEQQVQVQNVTQAFGDSIPTRA